MKAQSLSINLTGPCNATCPFCISRLTWKTGIKDNKTLLRCLPRALEYAKFHGVDTVLITGSGEPTSVSDDLFRVIDVTRKIGIPKIEVQTNGLDLVLNPQMVPTLILKGVTTIALSMAHPSINKNRRLMWPGREDSPNIPLLAKVINDLDAICRVSLNLIEGTLVTKAEDLPGTTAELLSSWAIDLKGWGVHELTLRELGMPSETTDDGVQIRDWIDQNAMPQADVDAIKREVEQTSRFLRRLPFGVDVYDYHGLSACVTTCLTDNINPEEIRSLILQPDGHVYHSWSFAGSILI